jgi:hypothetical protein
MIVRWLKVLVCVQCVPKCVIKVMTLHMLNLVPFSVTVEQRMTTVAR